MQLDHSLIREMYNAGMSLQDIKVELIKQHKSYNVVTIAQLRKICQNEIKEREGKGKAAAKNNPENYETISVLGRQVKVKKAKPDGHIPTEVMDKIYENTVLIEVACSTCSFKPAPGRPCAWPSTMCAMGHRQPLTYNPSTLLEEIAMLREKYKKVEEKSAPATKTKTKAVKTPIFEEDDDEESIQARAELNELEDEIAKAGDSMSAHERIGQALKAAKETEDNQIIEIDGYDKDDDSIDDMLESVEMSMPSDFSDEDFDEETLEDLETGILNLKDYDEE